MPNSDLTNREPLRRTPHALTPQDCAAIRSKVVPLGGAALLLLALSLAPAPLFASQASQPAAQPAHRRATAHSRTQAKAKKPAAGTAVPPRPNWPAEQPPNPAKVTWDSHGLAIQANNSSLEQILNEISTDTGVKLEGLSQDERVFGNYGPGPAREILAQLLDGSGYNMLMIGGRGDEPPRQVILTRSVPGGPQPSPVQNNAPNSNADEEGDAPEEPPQSYAEPAPPRGPYVPPRTPPEIQQEMHMRQQQSTPNH